MQKTIDREAVTNLVVESMREVLEQAEVSPPDDISESTVLVGKDAVLDSLGMVSLVIEVEQRIEVEYGITVTLANEKALSQRNSPFQTIGTLTDYVCDTIEQETLA